MNKVDTKFLEGPVGIAVLIGVAGVVVYALWGKISGLLKDAADTAGGVFSGDNALTKGTEYQGTGIFGTLGAAVDKTTGGAASATGDAIGSGLYSLLNGGTYDGYSFSASLHRWVQVIDRESGQVYNVDANGNITGPA